MSAVNITDLQAYAEKYRYELILLAVSFNELTQYCTVNPGIKDKETVTELRFNSLIKPYAKEWNPDIDKAKLIPRTIQVEIGQVELEEEPIKYRKTYLGHIMKNGLNPDDHPFEKVFLEGIMKQVNNDIVLEAAFYGDKGLRESGTTAEKKSTKAVNDGFFTILDAEITATNVSEAKKNLITTGTISSANALSVLKAFYRQAAEYYPGIRSKELRLYIPYNLYDAYMDNYQAVVGPILYNKEFEKTYLEGSARKCILTPMAAMGNTNRIILTSEDNMIYGVDTLSDQERIVVFNPGNPKVTGFLVLCAFGFQFASLYALFTNENGAVPPAASGSPSV